VNLTQGRSHTIHNFNKISESSDPSIAEEVGLDSVESKRTKIKNFLIDSPANLSRLLSRFDD
jgi:hypothetical protein